MEFVCHAVKCEYNEDYYCTRHMVALAASIDDNEPPYCVYYSDPMIIEMEKLKAIILHYGLSAQTGKAVEELIELSEVLIKDMNKGDLDKDGLYEEMADVLIMVEQLKIIYNIDTAALQKMIDRKICRTLERMDDHQI